MWVLIIVASLDIYQGAAVHTNYIDGIASRELCEQAAKAVRDPGRTTIKAVCIQKQP